MTEPQIPHLRNTDELTGDPIAPVGVSPLADAALLEGVRSGSLTFVENMGPSYASVAEMLDAEADKRNKDYVISSGIALAAEEAARALAEKARELIPNVTTSIDFPESYMLELMQGEMLNQHGYRLMTTGDIPDLNTKLGLKAGMAIFKDSADNFYTVGIDSHNDVIRTFIVDPADRKAITDHINSRIRVGSEKDAIDLDINAAYASATPRDVRSAIDHARGIYERSGKQFVNIPLGELPEKQISYKNGLIYFENTKKAPEISQGSTPQIHELTPHIEVDIVVRPAPLPEKNIAVADTVYGQQKSGLKNNFANVSTEGAMQQQPNAAPVTGTSDSGPKKLGNDGAGAGGF